MGDAGMPPRATGMEWLSVADDEGFVVGKTLHPVTGKVVIATMALGKVILLSPKSARKYAREFRSKKARAADLGWVADALEECAREVEAMTPAEHAAVLAQAQAGVQAMSEARGATRQ